MMDAKTHNQSWPTAPIEAKSSTCILAILFLASLGFASPAKASNDLVTIAGVVFNAKGSAASGVHVKVGDSLSALTDERGSFQLSVKPGTWPLSIKVGDGSFSLIETIEIPAAGTVELIVNIGARSTVVDVEGARIYEPAQVNEAPTTPPDSVSKVISAPGILKGMVVSAEDELPIKGARVLVRGISQEYITDAKGRFKIEIPGQLYDISILHRRHTTLNRRDFAIVSNTILSEKFALTPSGLELEAFTISSPRIEGQTTDLLEERKLSNAAMDVIGAEQFSKSGDSSAASALRRVVGLTLVDGKYIFVRGMGDRYSSVQLNGSSLPSPESQKRVVPLDMFPTSVIESIVVQKTFSPDMPADFGGGSVMLRTRGFPSEFSLDLSVGTGYDSETAELKGIAHPGGNLDWAGVDDGSRSIPTLLQEATDGKELSKKDRFGRGNYSPEELEVIGESLDNGYRVLPLANENPKLDLELEVGDGYKWGDVEAGYRLSFMYANQTQTRSSTLRSFALEDGVLTPKDNYSLLKTVNDLSLGGFLTGGIHIGEDHKIKFTSFINRLTDITTRVKTGWFDDYNAIIEQTMLRYEERELRFYQLVGQHSLPWLEGLQLDWMYSYSTADRNEPDRRQYRYDETSEGNFLLSDRPEGNNRVWSTVFDENQDASMVLTVPVPFSEEFEPKLRSGISVMRKDRGFEMRRFKYFDSSPDPEITILPPDEIFSAENIGPGGFELVELTRNTDNYRGHHYITSGFAMVEVPILDYAIVSAGLRVEDSDQEVNTFELFGEGQTTSKLSEVDTLGAMAVTIFLNESMQIRAGLGQTVNRPNLRELSPNAFDNYETGFTERGPDPATDPMLLRAKLMNLDLRWEWYLNLDEWITVGGFYKDFLNPIEDVEVPGATPQKTFINAAGATNVGVEVEGRKGLGFFSKMLRDFYITANVAFIDSQISIDTTGPTIIDVTNPERQLQGQSPYMLNIQLEYDNPETDTTVAILYNSYGRRITGAGATGIDDQYEEPVHLIDIVGSQTLGAGFKLKLKAQNILNATYRQTKGGQDVTTLQKGAKVGLGLSYSF